MQLLMNQSIATLVLFSTLVSHLVIGSGSFDHTGDTGQSAAKMGLSEQQKFATILPQSAAQIATSTEAIVRDLDQITLEQAAEVVSGMEVELAAVVMVEMDNKKAAAIMEQVDSEKGSLIMGEMPLEFAVAMMGAMNIEKASDIWSQVEKVRAGQIMEMVPTEIAIEVVSMVSEERLVPRLSEMSPQKLWEMPFEFLANKLPSVPVMHLASWNRPEPPDDLPPLENTRADENISEYTLAEAQEDQWALIVGSPTPIERVWARFGQDLQNIRIKVETFDKKPDHVPALPQGQIANSFFSISLENTRRQDIIAAAAIVSVDNSWLQANQVHKWAIQFNQFDENLGTWVPSPSKRIREDQGRIFFAVVVPGFSTLAISGSQNLVEPIFRVSDLNITPESPQAGEAFTISSQVTNSSLQTAVYPAKLWLNGSVEDAENIVVAPGATVSFSFTTRKPEGDYTVRVERLVDDIVVLAKSPEASSHRSEESQLERGHSSR
jgi:PGF-pre-PGF domain-containing protein